MMKMLVLEWWKYYLVEPWVALSFTLGENPAVSNLLKYWKHGKVCSPYIYVSIIRCFFLLSSVESLNWFLRIKVHMLMQCFKFRNSLWLNNWHLKLVPIHLSLCWFLLMKLLDRIDFENAHISQFIVKLKQIIDRNCNYGPGICANCPLNLIFAETTPPLCFFSKGPIPKHSIIIFFKKK